MPNPRLRAPGIRRLLLRFLLLRALIVPAAAKGPGTSAGDFLNLGVGARPVALGETFVGLADDVNAITYNPAGLAFLRRQELTLTHNQYVEGVRQEWVAYAYPGESLGTVALAVNMLTVDAFAGYDELDRPAGETSAQDSSFHLAYARGLGERLSLGVGSKLIKSRLAGFSATAVAFDAGLLATPWEQFSAGVSVQNAGSRLKHITESTELAFAVKGGFAVKPLAQRFKAHALALLLDVTVPNREEPYVSGGVEYLHQNALAVRAGAKSRRDTSLGYSLGLGLHFNRGHAARPELYVDYAFVDSGELQFTHRASITFKFGRAKSERYVPLFETRSARERPRRPEPRRQSGKARQGAEEAEIAPEDEKPQEPPARPRRAGPEPRYLERRDLLWIEP